MEDHDVEAFARSTRRKRQVRFAILGAIIASPFIYLGVTCKQKQDRIDARRAEREAALVLSDAERSELEATVARARATVAATRERWAQDTSPDALAAIQPGDAPCRIGLRAPTLEAADSYIKHGSIDVNYFGNVVYRTYPAGAAPGADTLASTARAIDEVAGKLAAGKADRRDRDRLARLDRYAVFVMAERQTAPLVTATSAGFGDYLPGELVGRSYVYSFRANAIVCAAALSVRSPDTIAIDFSYMQGNYLDHEYKKEQAAKAALDRDLDVRVRRALATQLRAVP